MKKQFDQIISALSTIIDQFGEQNLLHSKRVAIIAASLSEIVLPEKRDIIFYSSLLHDIGTAILGESPIIYLPLEEQKCIPHISEHPTISSGILSKLYFTREACNYIQDHHEWYNGNGYPKGKSGKEIPPGAQLIRIADMIDLGIKICQKSTPTDIYNYLRLYKGQVFNPDLWDAILELKNMHGGAFFMEILKNTEVHRIFSEIMKSVNPQRAISLSAMQKYKEILLPIFAEIIDAKHQYKRYHSHRVAFLSEKIAKAMELPGTKIRQIKYAAYLHDIGKAYIPSYILDENGNICDRELEIMRQHVIFTMEMLDTVISFRDLTPIAGFHQERYDGRGYPDGLSGEDIPIGARILNVADSIDAMLSDRFHRRALSVENAIIQLHRCAGTQFDPIIAHVGIGLLSNKKILEGLKHIPHKRHHEFQTV